MSAWDTPKNGSGGSNDYDPSQFYTHSRDKQKNKASARVIALPENIMAEIASAIASQKYPDYRTAADFIRDACVHRAHWLGENKDDARLLKAAEKDKVERDIARGKEIMDREEGVVGDIIEMLRSAKPREIDGIVKRGRDYMGKMEWDSPRERLGMELDRYRPEA